MTRTRKYKNDLKKWLLRGLRLLLWKEREIRWKGMVNFL